MERVERMQLGIGKREILLLEIRAMKGISSTYIPNE